MVLRKYKPFPQDITRAELSQAQRLIFKGKTFAATGDPRMQRIIEALQARGAQSAEEMITSREAAREAAEIQAAIEKQSRPQVPIEGPVRPGMSVEEFRKTGRSVPMRQVAGPTRAEFEVSQELRRQQPIEKLTILQRADKFAQRLVTPEGVRSFANLGAEVVLGGGKALASGVEKVLTKTTRLTPESKIFTAPSPISRATTKGIISDLFLFSAFAPFISTATAKEGSTVAKTVQKQVKPTDKKKIEALRQLREEIKTGSVSEVKTIIEDLAKSIKNRGLPPKEEALRLRNLEIFVREAMGQIKVVNGEILPIVDIGRVQAKQATGRGVEVLIEVPPVAQLKGTSVFFTGANIVGTKKGQFDPSVVGETKFLTSSSIFQDTKQDSKTKQKALQGLAQSLGLTSATTTAQAAAQDTAQDLATKQAQIPVQISVLTSKEITAQIPKQVSEFGKPTKIGIPTKTILTKPTGKFPPILGGVSKEVMYVAREVVKLAGFHGEVKEKGKWKRVTKKPRTKQFALALAAKVADNTTAVSIRAIKAKKYATKSPRQIRMNPDKFRDFAIKKGKKITLPNFGMIELKKARIDTPGEKKQLSVAKYLKTKEFSSLTKKKRRKKKPSFM